MKKLSVIMPVYNEYGTVLEAIRRVKNSKLKNVRKEIIIVDDASNDGTREILRKINDKSIKIVYHDKNRGKGCAIRTALNYAKGDIVLIQDADLEYDPSEYQRLISPIIEKKAKVV